MVFDQDFEDAILVIASIIRVYFHLIVDLRSCFLIQFLGKYDSQACCRPIFSEIGSLMLVV